MQRWWRVQQLSSVATHFPHPCLPTPCTLGANPGNPLAAVCAHPPLHGTSIAESEQAIDKAADLLMHMSVQLKRLCWSLPYLDSASQVGKAPCGSTPCLHAHQAGCITRRLLYEDATSNRKDWKDSI